MIDWALSIIAPHRCLNCCKEGLLWCIECQINELDQGYTVCYRCKLPTIDQSLCSKCRKTSPFSSFYIASEYTGDLERLIELYKFQRAYAAHRQLAMIIHGHCPLFSYEPSMIAVTSIPTSAHHIRLRGYDHTKLIAQKFAKLRNYSYHPMLARRHKLTQVGAGKKQRFEQANTAFYSHKVKEGKHILLIDDVVTSGATMDAAARELIAAGAASVTGLAVLIK